MSGLQFYAKPAGKYESMVIARRTRHLSNI